MTSVPEIEPRAVKELLDSGANVVLVDVREAEEQEIANIQGSILIPLGEIPTRADDIEQLTKDYDHVVIYCRTGGRSGQAVQWLAEEGISGPVNMRGGIHAYSDDVDPTLTKY